MNWHSSVPTGMRARPRGKRRTPARSIHRLQASGWLLLGSLTAAIAMAGQAASAQSALASELSELSGLRDRVRASDTRTRVDAFHRVWAIALASAHPEVKLNALELMVEPANSSSDHIRMPAVYAIAEIANKSVDAGIKVAALQALGGPLSAEQVPIRIVAMDAVSSIMRAGGSGSLAVEVLKALSHPVRSGNNGVRIPAIHAIVSAAILSDDDGPLKGALDLLAAPLDSAAVIGGMEVRMMAVIAVEKVGMVASGTGTKARAMGLLQSCASRSGWEPESRRRAADAAKNIENSMN